MTRWDDAILDELDECGPATVPELAARLDAHPATIERKCTRLLGDGRVRRATGGAYVRRECGADASAASD
jgi:DeoR/GlpR family transcriptional regulator of sugar metabolism